MGNVLVDERQYDYLKKKIKTLEKVIKKNPARLTVRQVQGVQSDLVVALPNSLNTWTFIDGLNITADYDSENVMLDWNVQASMSGVPSIVQFAFEVDGAVDFVNFVRFSPIATTRQNYWGNQVAMSGSGRHRYRLMISVNAAINFTLTSTARYLRITGLINERRRA